MSAITISISAHRPKIYRGGTRVGAGRKRVVQPMERHTITVHPADAKFLRSLDKNLSRAVRQLIAKARGDSVKDAPV